jgi:RimJ/RimL family protein N-acetyltransferase
VSAVLTTERLALQLLAPEDLDDYVALYADPQVVRFIGDGQTATREESADRIARTLHRNAELGWEMRTVRLHDGTFVGRCEIARHELDHGIEHEVGYILARQHRGRGYATEAATTVRDHAVGELGLRRLVALVADGNDASVRVAGKLGMRYERDVTFHDRPVRMYALEA